MFTIIWSCDFRKKDKRKCCNKFYIRSAVSLGKLQQGPMWLSTRTAELLQLLAHWHLLVFCIFILFFLLSKVIFFWIYICVCTCECVPCLYRCPWRMGQGAGSPRAGLQWIVRFPGWVLGTELWSSARAAGAANCSAPLVSLIYNRLLGHRVHELETSVCASRNYDRHWEEGSFRCAHPLLPSVLLFPWICS